MKEEKNERKCHHGLYACLRIAWTWYISFISSFYLLVLWVVFDYCRYYRLKVVSIIERWWVGNRIPPLKMTHNKIFIFNTLAYKLELVKFQLFDWREPETRRHAHATYVCVLSLNNIRSIMAFIEYTSGLIEFQNKNRMERSTWFEILTKIIHENVKSQSITIQWLRLNKMFKSIFMRFTNTIRITWTTL